MVDMGQADSTLRSTPSSQAHADEVFARHKQRMQEIAAQLEKLEV